MRYFFLFFSRTCVSVGICGFRGSHTRRPSIELFPDMVRQNRVRPETPSDFFPDGMSSRLTPGGTVAHNGPYVSAVKSSRSTANRFTLTRIRR